MCRHTAPTFCDSLLTTTQRQRSALWGRSQLDELCQQLTAVNVNVAVLETLPFESWARHLNQI